MRRPAGWSSMIDDRHRHISLANNVMLVCMGVCASLALVLWLLL